MSLLNKYDEILNEMTRELFRTKEVRGFLEMRLLATHSVIKFRRKYAKENMLWKDLKLLSPVAITTEPARSFEG